MKAGFGKALLSSVLVVALGVAMQAVAQVEVSTAEGEYGTHLVDSEGRSLYLFLPDDQALSTCSDDCAEVWPPLLADDVSAGEGVDGGLLSTVARPGEGRQVTYGSWPLYRYAGEESGATEGQGIGFAWYLVTPDGDALIASASESTAAEGGEATDDGGEEAGASVDEELFAALMDEGEAVFASTCAVCHGEEGDESLSTHVAILAGNDRAVGNAGRVIRRVLHGGSYMPPFGDALSDRQVAAVVTYVRNSWGNDFGAVTEEEVSERR